MWLWDLTLGVVFLIAWICFILYGQALRSVYTLGQMDYITHRNRKHDYSGIALWVYNKGRKKKAVEYKLRVHSTGRYYGNPEPR
jgi:hypothetical protein